MPPIWQIRDFEDSDLDQAVHLWEEVTIDGSPPLFRVAEVVAAVLAAEPALVAVVEGQVIGTVVSRVSGDRAWILRLAVSAAWHKRGVRSSLLDAIHRELLDKGVRQTTAVFPAGEVEEQLLLDHGFTIRPEVTYFERFLPTQPAELNLLAELGGWTPCCSARIGFARGRMIRRSMSCFSRSIPSSRSQRPAGTSCPPNSARRLSSAGCVGRNRSK